MTLKVWSLRSGSLLRTLEGHDDCVRAVAADFDIELAISGNNNDNNNNNSHNKINIKSNNSDDLIWLNYVGGGEGRSQRGWLNWLHRHSGSATFSCRARHLQQPSARFN